MLKWKKMIVLIDLDSDDSESGFNFDEVGWVCCFIYI